MPFQDVDGLRYFQFDSLQHHPVHQAIFTRHGGVSPEPWSTLNVGGTVGDEPVRVEENRRRAFDCIDLATDSSHDVWQVHSADYVIAREPRRQDPPQKADILITGTSGVTLFMRFADCVPIYLYDPRNHVIGLVHAGWVGTKRKAAEVAIQVMIREFGSDPQTVLAGLGPSIGPDHYQVGQDVIDQFEFSFGEQASTFFSEHNGNHFLDLWSANRYLLNSEGVSHIETAEICTVCNNEDWFSHRAERGSTGRFAALLTLE